MTTQVLKARKELLASKVSSLVSDTNENLLRVNLTKFFTDLEAEIQKALIEYWSDTLLLQGQLNLILAPIHEKHQEYYELIMRHKLQEFKRAKQSANRIVKREQKRVAMKSAKPVKFTHNRNNLFGTLQYSEDRLATNTFTASQNTLNRVDSNINQILSDGYKSGAGINEVGRQITERFDELRTWEANRIARTEIHTAQNMGIMSSYESLGVEYTQWITTHDSRVRGLKKGDRADHVKMDREIIPFGGTYSNGLAFPGDTSGPIEEWINCRCSNAPFVMPQGMMAPPFNPFKESDLISISEQTKRVESNHDILGDGTYTKYEEVSEHGRELDVYKFENIEIGIEKGSKFTFEDIVDHINSLPKEMVEKTHAERINIYATKNTAQEHAWGEGAVAGLYNSGTGLLRVFDSNNRSKEYIKDVFNHEFAHSGDLNRFGANILADPVFYEKYVQADNIHGIKNPTELDKLVYKAPTKYSGESYIHEINNGTPQRKYTEDIAESAKAYLNPNSHESFVKEFPNRAKYFEQVYGKPDFNKIKYENKGYLEESHKVTYHLETLQKQYDLELENIENQIQQLKEKRRELSEDKRREIRCEIKMLEKCYEEISDKRMEVFRAKLKYI